MFGVVRNHGAGQRAAVVVVAMCAVACGSAAPLSPTAEASVQSVRLEGGNDVPLGGTSAFKILAGDASGTERDVTAEGIWTSESELLSFEAPGLARGLATGSAVFRAVFQGRTVSRRVSVLPAGTFQVSGRVTEAGAGSFPVGEARVTVTAGIGTGLSAGTDWNGNFTLYGVAGPVRFDIAKDGYHTETLTVDVTGHGARHDAEMRLTRPHPDVSGAYVVTISASGQCGTGLGNGNVPEEARSRSYGFQVTQEDRQGPRLEGVFSAPGIRSYAVVGHVEPGRIIWQVQDPDPGDFIPDIPFQDRLSSGDLLSTRGIAMVATSATPFVGTLSGWLEVRDPATGGLVLASCSADDHQFVMTR